MLRLLRIVGFLGGACVVGLVLWTGVARYNGSTMQWIMYTAMCRDGFKSAVMLPDGSSQLCLKTDALSYQPDNTSPDGQWIVVSKRGYYNNKDLFLSQQGGANQQLLTQMASDEFDPVWSPDGKWIAFVVEQDRNQDIYRIRPDGTDLQLLTTDAAFEYAPSWSPDGGWIAYISNQDWLLAVYRMRSDGTMRQRLTDIRTNLSLAVDSRLLWSPDGEWIVFHALYWRNDMNTVDVYRLKSDGSVIQRLTDGSTNGGFGGINPY